MVSLSIEYSENSDRRKKRKAFFLFVGILFFLAAGQDYLFSWLKNTGFYLSESLLFNSFWILFLPFLLLIDRLNETFTPNSLREKVIYSLSVSIVFPIIHLLIFTATFVSISHLVFNPSHHFSSILSTTISRYALMLLLTYASASIVLFHQSEQKARHKILTLKKGNSTVRILPEEILAIVADKPYSAIHTQKDKYLSESPLKEYEEDLAYLGVIRVHKSSLINEKWIREIRSRSNGDFDAKLLNGLTIRLSRHYRMNWQHLLHQTD